MGRTGDGGRLCKGGQAVEVITEDGTLRTEPTAINIQRHRAFGCRGAVNVSFAVVVCNVSIGRINKELLSRV